MTEVEWLACKLPVPMLLHLGAKLSDRKLRLFSCACCRRVWNFARDERLGKALGDLEQYAEKAVGEKQRMEAGKLASAVRVDLWDETGREEEVSIACELIAAAKKSLRRDVGRCGDSAATAFAWAKVSEFDQRKQTERTNQTQLLRDIFGNPFRRVVVDPSWLTSTVVALAIGIYEEKAFDRMPILADALQDAGCDNDDILNHCRGPGPHVRGCWVVDLVLGKQ